VYVNAQVKGYTAGLGGALLVTRIKVSCGYLLDPECYETVFVRRSSCKWRTVDD
jgi:hypothetical protein